MCDNADSDYDDLEEDHCDKAESQADYEEIIQKKGDELEAAKADLTDVVLGDYLFDKRSKVKMALKNVEINDAIQALNDPRRREERSEATGQHIILGRCAKGRICVVYRDAVGEERTRAAYYVVTAYRPRRRKK